MELATGKVHLLEGGTGDGIVFLHHSWGSPGWLPVHSALADSHRVIVPDLPGWGGSQRPAWAREPRDIAILAGRILDALDLESRRSWAPVSEASSPRSWQPCGHWMPWH